MRNWRWLHYWCCINSHGSINIYEGNTDAKGPLREGYIAAATGLGFDKSMGVLAYDMADFGLSLHGKLKLLPKLSAFGEIEKPLYLNITCSTRYRTCLQTNERLSFNI